MSYIGVDKTKALQEGNWTVDLGATDNAVLDSIATNTANTATAVQLIDNAISGNEMQVDVVGSLPAGNNNIGNVDLASAIPAGSNTIGSVNQAGTWTTTVTQATASNLNATVTGTVELGATSLEALENISVTIPGTVDIGTVSLEALETITVQQSTASNFLNKPYGSVTTAAPAYTNGTDNALSLTTQGSLRTAVSESLPSGNNNIGNVDLASSIPAGSNVIGGVTQSGSWTVTANLSATDNAVLDDILADTALMVPDIDAIRVAVETIDNAISGNEMQVDVVASLPAGDNNIGNVDIASALPTGSNVIGAVTQSGTWNVNISDNSGSITVDGTVTANLSATDNAVLDEILADTALMVPDIDAIRVSTAAIDTSLNNIEAWAKDSGTTGTTTLRTVEAGADTSSVTSVASSATVVTLKAANTLRRGCTVYNNSTQILYVKLGSSASASSFTVKMQPDDYYEVPAKYNGIITGIWAAANGAALVTEIT